MPSRLALAGAVFAAIAALSGPLRASAEGNLVVYCAVQENGAATWSPLSSGRPASRSQ